MLVKIYVPNYTELCSLCNNIVLLYFPIIINIDHIVLVIIRKHYQQLYFLFVQLPVNSLGNKL